jgi:hypothetical protein
MYEVLGDSDKRLCMYLERLGIDFVLFSRDDSDLPEHMREIAHGQIEEKKRVPVLFRNGIAICHGEPDYSDLKYLLSLYPDSGVKY